MSVKLVNETRKAWTPQRRHRQRHFWNVSESSRLDHLMACDKCWTWRRAIAQEKAPHLSYGKVFHDLITANEVKV
jgi:hypothetical protein